MLDFEFDSGLLAELVAEFVKVMDVDAGSAQVVAQFLGQRFVVAEEESFEALAGGVEGALDGQQGFAGASHSFDQQFGGAEHVGKEVHLVLVELDEAFFVGFEFVAQFGDDLEAGHEGPKDGVGFTGLGGWELRVEPSASLLGRLLNLVQPSGESSRIFSRWASCAGRRSNQWTSTSPTSSRSLKWTRSLSRKAVNFIRTSGSSSTILN